MRQFIISKFDDGIRLNKYLKKMFASMPDSLIYKLLRKKYFEINDKKASGSEILHASDKLSIFLGDDTYNKYLTEKPSDNPLYSTYSINPNFKIEENRIVYEDDNILLYDKPKGILSQSDDSGDESINDIVNIYLQGKGKSDCLTFKPSVVNRLDKNTSGIIIIAKTYLAAREISRMIKDRLITKKYFTVVNGIIEGDFGELINYYKKDEKRNIALIKDYKDGLDVKDSYSIVRLKYKVLERDIKRNITKLDIDLLTGKSHQIRAQFSHIGHPIICDKKYMELNIYEENKKIFKMESQYLVCYKIKFDEFENDMLRYLDKKEFVLRGDYEKKI